MAIARDEVREQERPLAELGSDRPGPGVTVRAVLVGGAGSLFLGVALPYANMIIKGSLLDHNFNTPAALFLFLIVVAIIHPVLCLANRGLGLTTAELATIYIMVLLATSIPTIGFSEYLLPIVAGFYYYATPENQWDNLIHPHMPPWLVPQDADAVRYFYEGLPAGRPVPWDAWAGPLAYWCVFILAVYWVSVCTMVLLRKQWMEREKLLYPLIQVPLEMIRDDSRGSLVKPFLKNPVMWIGFSIPFVLGSWTALHSYFPAVPALSTFSDQGILTTQFMLFRNTTVLIVMLNLGLVGFAYLLSREIAMGLWVFFMLANLERGVFNVLGIQSTESLSRFANLSGPYLAHQAMGAMIVLIFAGLWTARGHLRDVAAKVFSKRKDIDDSAEALSYRQAVGGLVVGLLVCTVWLWKSGLPLWVVPVFLFAAFVVFMTLTRAVVEGGVAVIRTPLTPADFVISGLGTSNLGGAGLASLGLTYVWAANIRLFLMPCFANALKLTEYVGGNRRLLIWAVVLSVLASLGGSIWSVMTLSYAYGGVNLHEFWYVGEPTNAGIYTARVIANPTGANLGGWLFTLLGALIMVGLTFARAHLMWWPLHPLGFAISTFFIMNYVWFSVFVAWLIKTVVLKYGGPGLYRSTRPLFLGLIMGQVVVAGLWLIIDFFTGMQGNQPIGGSFV
ncbi:MAG: DUF6785 family protein [Candidatus Latescibacterota bacterium]